MTGILDRVAKSRAPQNITQQYRPATPEHFFVLRLAQRLNDAPAVHHYIELYNRYSEAALLSAYHTSGSGNRDRPATAFHTALGQMRGRNSGTNSAPAADLAAIRIERRAIAVAIFSGTRLKYPPIARQLSSDTNKALGSAASFINRLRDKCAFTSAALEHLPTECEAQRSQLSKIISDVLAERQVAIQHFSKMDVLGAFGYPPLRFRKQVREVVSAMWPDVNGGFGSPLVRDALALGLFAETERLFFKS